MSSLRTYWTFARPFTLVPPMTGIFSGTLLGYGATHAALHPVRITLAVLAAGVLNAASNALNQICDLTNDHINKPHRPLPSGASVCARRGFSPRWPMLWRSGWWR